VDTETTGLGQNASPPRPDGVVQVGYAWRAPDAEVIRWQATCNPGESYLREGRAFEALRVNGLMAEEVLSAPSARKVAGEFRQRLTTIARKSGSPVELRSFNRDFDEPFLAASPWDIPSELWGPCLMQAAQDYLGHWKWPRLEEALAMLDLRPPPGRSHTAAVDAHSALLIYETISRKR